MGVGQALPTVGTLSYSPLNRAGWTFDAFHHSSVNGTPEWDDANRVITCIRWTIRVHATIANTSAALQDTRMLALRRALLQPGGVLTYQDKAVGNILANVGNIKDLKYGPRPELLGPIVPVAGQAALIDWQITTWLPQCPDGDTQLVIMAFNHQFSWDIDQDGYTTRATSGYLEIAANRSAGKPRLAGRTADDFRDRVAPAPIPGFIRNQNYRISLDKRRLDFNIVDSQLAGSPLPSGVSQVKLTHRLQAIPQGGSRGLPGLITGIKYNLHFSGSVTTPPNTERGEAYDAFLIAVASRLRSLNAGNPADVAIWSSATARLLRNKLKLGAKGFAMPTAYSVSEDVFGRSTQIEMGYVLIWDSSLEDLLADSGLWQPISDKNGKLTWAKWTQSLTSSVFHERGQADLGDQLDTLVDICGNTPPIQVREPEPEPPPETKFKPQPEPKPKENPDGSWFEYSNRLLIITRNRVSRHKRLPPAPFAGGVPAASDPTQPLYLAIGEPAPAQDTPERPAPTADRVQDNGTPEYSILMVGFAERLGLRIPIPRLIKVSGIEVTQEWAEVLEDTPFAILGVPIRKAAWMISYILPEAMAGKLPDLDNPFYGIEGG